MNLEIDLYSDWIELLRSELVQMGYVVPAVTDPHEIAFLYFNALGRRVSQKPRKIWKSKEFNCPASRTAGLALLEQKVIAGHDLNPHVSRKIVKLEFQDGLLNDWGIQHFHLGTSMQPDGLIEGTKEVLFARVTETDFYEIRVDDHGTWSEFEMVETLHSNWPETIQRFRLHSVANTIPTEATTVQVARSNGLLLPITTKDGTCYAPMGGGIASDRSGIGALENADAAAYQIKHLQEDVAKALPRITTELKKHGYAEGKPLKARLVLDNGNFRVKFPDYNYLVDS